MFSEEQLDSDIVLLHDGKIEEREIDIDINDESLYLFCDTNMETYVDFESDENASEYNGTKLLESNYPIITIK